MNHFAETRDLLAARLRLLEARLEEIQRLLREPEDDDLVEQAGELGDDDTLERLARLTWDETLSIRAALRMLADGRYGRCESCGSSIGASRLRALPAATTCIECAEADPGLREAR
jgi:RNA polymerase-binding transcription factor DksA